MINLLHVGCNVGTESMPKYFNEQCNYKELYLDGNLKNNLQNFDYVPDIIFLQIQSDTVDKKNTCDYIGEEIKALKEKGSFVINWTGDKRRGVPGWMYQFAPNVSITGFSNEEDVNEFNNRISNGAIFLQQGIDTNIFKPEGERADTAEIVFLANNYGNEFPLSQYRKQAVNALKAKYGSRFKVYGNGWGADSGNVNSSQYEEAKVYRGCKIAISISHFDSDRYFSDRLGRALSTGAFVLSHNYKGIEKDFEVDEDLVVFDDIPQMLRIIDNILADDDARNEIAEQGQKLASKEFSYKNIVTQIINFKL